MDETDDFEQRLRRGRRRRIVLIVVACVLVVGGAAGFVVSRRIDAPPDLDDIARRVCQKIVDCRHGTMESCVHTMTDFPPSTRDSMAHREQDVFDHCSTVGCDKLKACVFSRLQ